MPESTGASGHDPVRVERDILLALSGAGVADAELGLFLVSRRLSADGATREEISSAVSEVLRERPQLRRVRLEPSSLPGPLPVEQKATASAETQRRSALEQARSSGNARDLAHYLRLRRGKRS